MTLFNYRDEETLGYVTTVDTGSVIVQVANVDLLRKLQVNRLVVLQSARPGQHLVGIVSKIIRKATTSEKDSYPLEEGDDESNTVRISLIGTMLDVLGEKRNVFRRTLETVPEIESRCFSLEGEKLTSFMRTISSISSDDENRLTLGHYTLDESAEAFLSGNKFFQRHAVIVGSTGSGKSWTTAKLIEQVSVLASANAILFDIHGEYRSLKGNGIKHYKVASPDDIKEKKTLKDGVLHFPIWLLNYEKLVTMLVDRSDQNAPNQAMLLSRTIVEAKKDFLTGAGKTDVAESFTIDSPIPFRIPFVLGKLNELNIEMVEGKRGEKQGEFHGKLGRLIQRLESKVTDRRLGFMFSELEEIYRYEWLAEIVSLLMNGSNQQADKQGGVKIIDFSEVPSDILPLIVSMVTELIFFVQQWTVSSKRHPISVICDEAHLYIPETYSGGSMAESSLNTFERVAKEGRKYGVGLVIVSQRPSEVNKTVMSQCNNFIAMRLVNSDDQSVIKRLLPDNLGGFSELLPILDVGEALVVGDASLLPSRIRISVPESKPDSGTIDFWTRWSTNNSDSQLAASVEAFRRQSRK